MTIEPTDLPLFSWTPPECEVIPFPARLRVGKARHVASQMNGTTEKGAAAYWRRALTTMVNQMEKAGVSQDRIEAETEAFKAAVQSELDRLAMAERNSKPGGAA